MIDSVGYAYKWVKGHNDCGDQCKSRVFRIDYRVRQIRRTSICYFSLLSVKINNKLLFQQEFTIS